VRLVGSAIGVRRLRGGLVGAVPVALVLVRLGVALGYDVCVDRRGDAGRLGGFIRCRFGVNLFVAGVARFLPARRVLARVFLKGGVIAGALLAAILIGRIVGCRNAFSGGFGRMILAGTSASPSATAALGAAALFVLLVFRLVGGGLGLGLQQRLTVSDRDLVVIRVDFAEGEEAVTVSAIFDECRLKRRFDPVTRAR